MALAVKLGPDLATPFLSWPRSVYTARPMSPSASPAAAAGALDEPAFKALYEAEFGYVFNSLRRLGVHRGDIEDLTHDTFATAWRRRESFEAGRPVRPWLFGIAYRLASDFRALARHKHEVADEGHDAQHDAASPEESLEKSQARKLVAAALEELELDRRAVFIMHEIDGHAIPLVAESLGIPLNTAYSRLRLARADFAQAVKKLTSKEGTR